MKLLKTKTKIVMGFAIIAGAAIATPMAIAASDDPPALHLPKDYAESEITQARRAASPSEAPALADGTVSFTEYREQVTAVIECIKAEAGALALSEGIAGEVVAEVLPAEPEAFSIQYTYGTRGVPESDFGRMTALRNSFTDIEAACVKEHLDDVQRVYQVALAADASYIKKASNGFLECAVSQGIEVGKEETPRDLVGGSTQGRLFVQGRAVASAEAQELLFPCIEKYPVINEVLQQDG